MSEDDKKDRLLTVLAMLLFNEQLRFIRLRNTKSVHTFN